LVVFSVNPLMLIAGILVGITGLLAIFVWRQSRQRTALSPPNTSAATAETPTASTSRPARASHVVRSTTTQSEDPGSADPEEDQSALGIDAMLAQLEAERSYDSERLKQVRRYLQAVIEQYKLPPFPTVVTTALRLVRNENSDLRQIERALSNDAALAGRILSLSRSPIFALRQQPRTLQEAISVLGLRALESTLVAAGAQSIYAGRSKAAQTAWSHSLVTALASQFLARRIGIRDVDQAFLAGLLHDIGQMVILHGDKERFEGMWIDVRLQKKSAVAWEQDWYHLDHTWIGASVLYRWGLETEPILAILHHHDVKPTVDPTSLDSIVQMANFLADRIGLGFLSAPDPPSQQLFESYSCDTEEHMQEVSETLQQMFKKEKALFS
jgi:putative nucleotidyltransferase with HDIG domain